MTGAYRVTGADQLEATMHLAADELRDLSGPANRAGDVVVGAARTRAPRRSGALGASLHAVATPDGVAVTSNLPYAGPIHWGWPARNIRPAPFLSDAATSTESTWVGFYSDAVDAAVDKVRGA